MTLKGIRQVLRRPEWWAVLIALAALVVSISTFVQSQPYRELGAVYSRLEILEKRLETCQSWIAEWERKGAADTQLDEMKADLLGAEAKLNTARGKAIGGQLDLANINIEDANELLDRIPNPYPQILRMPLWVFLATMLGCVLIVSLTMLIVRGRKTKK